MVLTYKDIAPYWGEPEQAPPSVQYGWTFEHGNKPPVWAMEERFGVIFWAHPGTAAHIRHKRLQGVYTA